MPGIRRWLPIPIFVLTCLAFVPSLDGQFVNWDDLENFLKPTGWRGLGWAQLTWMWTTAWFAHYHPLTWMTLGLNYVLGGLNPWGYHAGNILIHGANAVVFFVVARQLMVAAGARDPRATWGAGVAALVFALHPLRVESVAWATERKDVLYAFFLLLSVSAYVRSVAAGGASGRRWRWASLAAFLASLLSKSAAMPLPVILLVLDVYPLRRVRLVGWRAVLLEKVPYLVLSAATAVVAYFAAAHGTAMTSYGDYGVVARTVLLVHALVFQAWKFAWPVALSPLYETPLIVDLFAGRFVLAIVAFVLVTIVCVVLRRRAPGLLAAWACWALMIAIPVSGAVHVGYHLAADRYTYVAGLGFNVLLGAGFAWLVQRHEERRRATGALGAIAAGAAAVLILLGAMTWQQSKAWRNSETLWRTAIRAQPSCALCYSNLASAIADQGRHREAEAFYRQSIALRPTRAATHNNLGVVLLAQGRPDEAKQAFRDAFRLEPGLATAKANLGSVYARERRWSDAIPLFRQALDTAPAAADVRANLLLALRNQGTELAQAGRLAEATERFREAVAVSPDNADALRFLGQALLEQGQVQAAIPPLARAVALAPNTPPSRFWLAKAYLVAGDRERADAELAALRRLDPSAAAILTEQSPAPPRR